MHPQLDFLFQNLSVTGSAAGVVTLAAYAEVALSAHAWSGQDFCCRLSDVISLETFALGAADLSLLAAGRVNPKIGEYEWTDYVFDKRTEPYPSRDGNCG